MLQRKDKEEELLKDLHYKNGENISLEMCLHPCLMIPKIISQSMINVEEKKKRKRKSIEQQKDYSS